jgi:YVTN family beta-propeller protein
MKTKLLLIVLFSTIFYSCSKDNSTQPVTLVTKGVFVINEGLYNQNNSEITFYDPSTNQTITNFYSQKNGKIIGDNANSMFIFDNKGYIAVDGSNKIEVIDLKDGSSLGIIDLGQNGSPREIFILNSNRGFVTSFSKNSVIEFNPTKLTITREIPVGKYPEGIAFASNKLFVANSNLGNGNTVSIIDLNSNSVAKTLQVGRNPRFVGISNDSRVIVGCSGDFFDAGGLGGYYFIDPVNLTITDSILLKYHPQDYALTKDNLMFYINDRGIGKINLTTKNVDTVFIDGMNVNDIYGIVYSLAFDEIEQKLYAGNPKNFTQNGEVKIFDRNGNYLKKFDTKINPGAIYFYR